MPEHQSLLCISHKGKVIPYYGPGIPRDDGDANYGFKNLKSSPQLLDSVPELATDGALRSLVAAINRPETELFTIGCLSGPVQEDQGCRYTGYVEFALNSASAIQDAVNYFPVFFHFDRFLQGVTFAVPVVFHWELQPADFLDANVSGFTCAVVVNTHFVPTPAAASAGWRSALNALEHFLGSIHRQSEDPLYRPA